MQVSVIPHLQQDGILDDSIQDQTVVIIDVFRASSSIVTALSHGADTMIPVETIVEAKERQAPGMLLAGERQTKKIVGFDLGNSPAEFRDPTIKGKTILFTTTNGTRALEQARKAAQILIGSLLNAESCSKAIHQANQDVTLLCAGTEGNFSFEDAICAGAIISFLKEYEPSLICDDLGETLYHSYFSMLKADFVPLLKHRTEKLSEQDRKDCLQLNQYSVVPYLLNGKLQSMN